jgi:hypothetical protein
MTKRSQADIHLSQERSFSPGSRAFSNKQHLLFLARQLPQRSPNRERTVARMEEPDLARDILGYLLANPEGKDTIEGIARFWIMSRKIETLVDNLQSAVQSLVDQGYLEEKLIRNSSGEVVGRFYQLNDSHIKDIAALVGADKPSGTRR